MIIRWITYLVLVVAVVGTALVRSRPFDILRPCTADPSTAHAFKLMSWMSRSPPAKAGYLAVRNISPNTRISPTLWTFKRGQSPANDWGLPKSDDLNGKYTRNVIKKDDPIQPQDLSDWPSVTFDKDSVPLTYGTNDLGPLADYLNTGAQVYVCDQDSAVCPGGPFEVEAMVGKTGPPLMLICPKKTDADQLRKIKKPVLRIAALP